MDRDTAEPSVESLPGERAERWVEHHHERAAPSTYVYDFVWDVTAPAAGPFCTDVDGNVLLDFTSHVCSAPLGYNNPTIQERLREFDLVDPLKIAGQDFYVSGGWPPEDPEFPGPTQLLDRITDLTEHYGLDTVFLSNSGAEANENAMKICHDSRPTASSAVTFHGGFHGRTTGTLSLNRSKSVHRRSYPELAGVHDVPFCDDAGCDPGSCACGFFSGDSSALREMVGPGGYLDPDDVAYLMIEPIQGEGGYRVPSDAFLDEVAAVCDEHGIPVVADEIQSGMGRTGEWWASDHYALEPDVVTSAKALRVGATVASADTFPDERGRLSSTWGGGDIIAAMQGALTIDVIREQDLLANATERGEQLRAHLRDEAPAHVVDVRGKGLMNGVEFDSRDRRDAVVDACLERGLLTIGCGRRTLRLLPPLDVTEREIRLGAELFCDAVADPAVADPPVADEDRDSAA